MHEETAIQNRIRVALSQYGVVFRQNSGVFTDPKGQRIRVGAPGMSDLLYIGAPRTHGKPTVAWLEVKTAKGRPSAEQLKFIEAMKKEGCLAGIVRSPEEALRLIGMEETEVWQV